MARRRDGRCTEAVLTDAKGKSLANKDLFLAIFKQLRSPGCPRTFFQHVKRNGNAEADSLAAAAFKTHLIMQTPEIAAVQTRHQRRQQELATIPNWRPTPRFDEDDEELQTLKWDYEGDEVVVMLSGSDSDSDQSVRNQQLHEPQDECEVDSESEDERPRPKDSTELPDWTPAVIFKPETRNMRRPPILRLEAPYVDALLKILAKMPTEQLEDPFLRPIVMKLKSPGQGKTIPPTRSILNKYSLSQPENTLQIQLTDGRKVFAVPESLQIPIMDIFHKSPVMGGHPQAKATELHIKRYFYWEKMVSMIHSYCASCEACKAGRNQAGKALGFLTLPQLPNAPFMKIHADTLCCLPKAQGYKHVLVVMDAFTKFIFTYPLRSSHPKHIVAALTNVFGNFGQPALFVADNGSEFHNWEVVNFLRLWGVQWQFPAPYNPQANGQAEAGVKIVTNKLRLAIVEFMQRCPAIKPEKIRSQWPAILPYVTYAYNSCPIEALEFSPYELVFGRSPRLPITVKIDEEQINSPQRVEAAQYLRQLQFALEYAHEYVEEKTIQRRQRMTDTFNNKRSPLLLKAGDHVYITHPYNQKPRKLEPRARGPYKVEKVSQHPDTHDVVSVTVDITPPGCTEKQFKVFARKRLRPIRSRLPTIDWQNCKPYEVDIGKEKDLADLLEIKEKPNAPKGYVVMENENEEPQERDEYLFDIIEVQSDNT